MARIPGLRALFRLPASERGVAGEVDDEIAFHLEERARELEARGLEPAAARAEAEREFGDLGEARAELERIGRRRVRRVQRSGWWGELGQDLRFAARTLRNAPGFTLVAVLTLALGIGATTAIYTVVDAVLLRPLGVGEPERVVVLGEREREEEPGRIGSGTVSPANFYDWAERARSFESMSYFVQWPVNLTGDGEPTQIQAQLVSPDYFRTLAVSPLLGRGFMAEDTPEPGSGDVAVLSYGLWRGRYGGDPGIIGRTIQLNDAPVVVIGVMGPDFQVLDARPALWVPYDLPRGDRTNFGRFLTGVARLAPGVGPEEAQRELDEIARQLEREYPDFNTDMTVTVMPLREQVLGDVRPALLVLLGAVAMLLLIASTNVANLLLGRASARRREIAVRLSLGATRGRLVRQLLTESLVLAMAGGVVGVVAAALATGALVRSLPATVSLPRMEGVSVDAGVLAVALGVTLLTGVLFGLAPALVASRSDLQASLRDESRGSTGGRVARRMRSTLVVAEVALALMLLVGAGLLLRSFWQLQEVDLGMRAEGVLTMQLELSSNAYDSPEARQAFVGRLFPALEALPGVQAVGSIWFLPLSGDRSRTSAFRADRPRPVRGEEPAGDVRVVAGDYFEAQGIELLRGRVFDERDHAEAPPVTIINEALAREQFPGEEPVGRRLAYNWGDDIEAEIVGVVADTREAGVTEDPETAFYRPFPQWPDGSLNVMIRTTGDPMALAGAARAEVRRLDPNLPVSNVRPMESVVADTTARSRLSSYLLGGFAAIALLLAAVGLYGIISHAVTQRRGEIGVRVALGADRASILRLIVGHGMALTAVGLAVGLLGAVALTRLLRSLLYGVSATDLATFAVVSLLLAGVALLASYLPASRAARLDPAHALRTD